MFSLYLLALRKKSVDLTQIDRDIPSDESLHDAGNDIVFNLDILIQENFPLLLQDHLLHDVLGCRRRDTAEVM